MRTEVSNMNDEEEETKIKFALNRKFIPRLIDEDSESMYFIDKITRALELETSSQKASNNNKIMKLQDDKTVMNRLKLTDGKRVTNSIHDHLIKLIMFFVTIFCSQTLGTNCQKHHFHPNSQFLTSNEHLILNERQALDQMVRTNNYHHHHQHQHENSRMTSSRTQQPADRRVSAGSFQTSKQERTQSKTGSLPQHNDNGKLLVCYYTTRQSAPYWPKDAREYAIPPDGLNTINSANDMSQMAVTPIIQYEPFVINNGQQSAVPDELTNNMNMKNQQQQLVFKSAAVQSTQLVGGQIFNGIGSSKEPHSSSSNNGDKSKQHQDTISQMISAEHQQQHHNPMVQQTLVITGPTISNNKHKQTPLYSFIGDLDNNNGLIVSGGSGTVPPTVPLTAMAPTPLTLHQGNNGNNFIIAKDNNGNHLERNSIKQAQAQQLVFSPSLSRAFIVSGSGSSNNEIVDTKSQIFIPSSQTHNNHNHQQASAATSGSHLYHQDSPVQKGKSLQILGGEQLSPANPFSGAVSSAPPVPLSSASSASLSVQTTASYRNSQQQFSPSTTNTNQLIDNNGLTNVQKSTTAGGSNMSSLKLQYTSATNGDNLGSRLSSLPPSSSLIGSSSSTSNIGVGLSPSSSPSTGGSLSSALVSSPLSTMFDVFGAASQYLMRFKPSSLMSSSSFASNTIPNDHHQHQHHDLKSGNSSLIGSVSSSSGGSIISLPFSTNLIANIQKSSSSNDRSSTAANVGAGILSRFTIQNNQRREDVCGRTIQTPQRRIIGGEGARYGEFPYQVHIKIAKHQCGGALVDKQSIITAAHCVYHFITRAPVNKLQIVIGAYDIEDEQYQELPPQYFKVNKVKLHPNFRFSASHPDRYDIAILKLDKPVKYTDNVLPVCLPSKDLKLESTVGTVTGFGKTDPSLSNRYGTRLLQKVDVPIIENNECERWHRTRGIDLKIFPEMMCAGYEDGLKDACVGDSGGPLVVKTPAGPNGSFRWTLAGITSAGFGCAQSRQPGIYHRVSHTVDWILENLD